MDLSRARAATDAGLSERQKVTALRVGSVPNDEFNAAFESDSPPNFTHFGYGRVVAGICHSACAKPGYDDVELDMELPDSFPPSTIFADVEGVPCTLVESTGACRAWDTWPERRFSIASFNHNGTLVPESKFRALVAKARGEPFLEATFATVIDALAFAAGKHRDQRRKGADPVPYINHPIAVVRVLLCEAQIADATILAAAALHDTVEDTATTFAELHERFGAAITAIVREVTDDKALPKAERKRLQVEHAAHISTGAKAVKLADKICNLRDIRTSPPDWPLERRREYFEWAKRVVDAARGSHPVLEGLFDAEYALRPNALS